MTKELVVSVTKEMFALSDGREYPHVVDLDSLLSCADFQKIYDYWSEILGDKNG